MKKCRHLYVAEKGPEGFGFKYFDEKIRHNHKESQKAKKMQEYLEQYHKLEHLFFGDKEIVDILMTFKNPPEEETSDKYKKNDMQVNVYLAYLKIPAFICLMTYPDKYINLNMSNQNKIELLAKMYSKFKKPYYEHITLSLVDYICKDDNEAKIYYIKNHFILDKTMKKRFDMRMKRIFENTDVKFRDVVNKDTKSMLKVKKSQDQFKEDMKKLGEIDHMLHHLQVFRNSFFTSLSSVGKTEDDVKKEFEL